ncbi:glycoside hydrolase family 32 protein [Mucilaginibacter gotjawali]|uniref:Fructan beta-fructosidase n=1 Tax=Mucilaginibacter gotjawali TaxID=1550579 RepID=A0A839SPP6_9SPHI|nr:glycoside hydrolase family 32 protein [Mucilaginibacter gotjawali]MBB3058800.1 fructan beta-fructosidase [Mucilaginibacter gotjawali]
MVSICSLVTAQQQKTNLYNEPFRPQLHFSPKAHWMNDPNGMVYFNHTYHLFFQYYPGGTVWGPMHWGHAISKDLVHWQQLPIALYPDSLGYIFSGSAVVDSNNTSGFGKNGKIPLVAIFTHHDPKGERAGTDNFQNESIAYSLDEGRTWTKYSGNPVLKNPGIRDFRDPKVMWYAKDKKWVMTLATKDHITFYSSRDLKTWAKESEFGKEIGAHGGVWECPDLFPLKLNGKQYWVLVVNLNPGGPNGGSATQYFVGQFDGEQFVPVDDQIKWLDYGPDEYAGITWNNTGSRKIFLGWMSNWSYATQVPTASWRSAMTIPRDLKLISIDGNILLTSMPVKAILKLKQQPILAGNVHVKKIYAGNTKASTTAGRYLLDLQTNSLNDFALELANSNNEKLIIGFDKNANQYFIDRTKAGVHDFNKDFAGIFKAPRFVANKSVKLTLVVDRASVEIFADGGATVMTCIFFTEKPLNKVSILSDSAIRIKSLSIAGLKSIW